MQPTAPPHLLELITVTLALALSGCATRQSPALGEPTTYDVSPQPESSALTAPMSASLADSVWPRYVPGAGATNILYQPQVDSWDGHQLVAREAVAIHPPGRPLYVYGVVTIRAITLVDKAKHTVSLEQIQVLAGDFPSERENDKANLLLLQKSFPKELTGLSLDRLESSFSVAPQALRGSAQPLNNTPPRIIFATKPSLLVYIDGPPIYRPVPGTQLQRVINSGMLLFKDQGGRHYLRSPAGYLTAPDLTGPWTVASQVPPGAKEAEAQMGEGEAADLVAPQPLAPNTGTASSTNGNPPLVYVATTPAELVIFQGEPNFVPIPDTHLLYVANTTANVFKLLTDQKVYVLLSGRWFRAPSLDGPWQYVPATQLASDFESIPDTSPKENVKASVPGTAQATEALIANSIPQGTKVQRSAPMQDPRLDGAPQLQPIAGTPLYYVVNSATPIIKVDDNSWYACQNGVWFVSTSVNGPWVVAASIPAVIYSIPPSSPLHYLTYVRIYGTAPDVRVRRLYPGLPGG